MQRMLAVIAQTATAIEAKMFELVPSWFLVQSWFPDWATIFNTLWPRDSAEFFLGCLVLGVVETSRFREVSVIAPIPGVKARDFVGRPAYVAALFAFILTICLSYYAICQFSPEVIQGFVRFVGGNRNFEL